MSLEMNACLTKLNAFATAAANNEHMSGEDTVIQTTDRNKGGLVSRQWTRLGSRSDDFKRANLCARQAFFESICEQFGGFDKIPKSVRNVMKLGDFKLNSDGNVTSNRPLTARRIKAICDVVRAYNRANDPTLFNPLTAQDYEKLTPKLKADYERYVGQVGAILKETGSSDFGKMSVARFVTLRLMDIAQNVKNLMPTTRSFCRTMLMSLMDDIKGGTVSACSAACIDLLSALTAENQKALFAKARAAKVSPQDQARIYAEANNRLQSAVVKMVTAIYKRNEAPAKPIDATINGLLKGFDFTSAATYPELTADMSYDFMTGYISQYEEEFTAAKGNVNELYHGEMGNKFVNLIKAFDCARALKKNTELPKRLSIAVDEEKKFKDSKRYQARLDYIEKKRQAFEAEKLAAEKAGKPFTKVYSAPAIFPVDKCTSGEIAAGIIKDIMGVGAHENINTPTQFREAYEMFSGIDDLFFRALEMDHANGDTRMVDMLLDALNTDGCLQGRCTHLQEVCMALDPELGNVKEIDVRATDKVMAAMGKIIQQLQEKEGDEVDYAEAAKLLERACSKDGQPGERVLDFDIPGVARNGEKVTVTADFLMKPEVADILKASLPYFKG